jgi:purine-nucleoside phosphorylase
MTEQRKLINLSFEFIKQNSDFRYNPELAVICYKDSDFLKSFKIISKLKYSKIPPEFNNTLKPDGDFILAETKSKKSKFYFLNGFNSYYSGFSMKQTVHYVYVLKQLGVKKILFIDEAGYFNPRYKISGVSLVYDQINLMGDNPLIGENDDSLGIRFPDMSEPFNVKQYNQIVKLFRESKFEFYESVYLGLTGPETETEAECRFYRDIGADIAGYNLVPLVIASVHCRIKCSAIALLTRELVADRLTETASEEKLNNRKNAEKKFSDIFIKLIESLQ